MNSREAREILACYRRGLDDEADPRLAEALELARQDLALGGWLEEQTALDAALREQFRRIAVPADLREKILARRPVPPATKVWWRQPWLHAAAAGFAALAVIAGFWLANRLDPFDAYRRGMTGLVSGRYEINLKTNRFDEIRDYLATRGWPSDYTLTPAMQELEAEGVSVINWRGRKVSLICLEAGEDEDLFLFVVERSVFRDPPETGSPRFARVGGMTTATWTAGGKVYFLAGHADEQSLRKYL